MLAAILVVVLATVTGAGITLGAAIVARHRAQSAADLAALAAAARMPAGAEQACLQAQAVAASMRATVAGCDVESLDVVVTVVVGTGLRIGGAARATARAGPISRG